MISYEQMTLNINLTLVTNDQTTGSKQLTNNYPLVPTVIRFTSQHNMEDLTILLE